jgi:Flp pilus assembly protein TadG
MRKQLLKKTGDERGSALLEFAFVIPIFVFVLYALIAFGMQLATTQRVVNAAAEGARAAVGHPSDAAIQAEDRVKRVLGTAGFGTKYMVDVDLDVDCTGCIKVTVVYNYDDYPAVPAGMGISYDKIISSAVVKYQ